MRREATTPGGHPDSGGLGPGSGYGLLLAVVVSGIVSAIGWMVARAKQRRLEQLEAEMEAQANALGKAQRSHCRSLVRAAAISSK